MRHPFIQSDSPLHYNTSSNVFEYENKRTNDSIYLEVFNSTKSLSNKLVNKVVPQKENETVIKISLDNRSKL